jgi:large subunit ribosomal protein LP1
MSTAEQACTYAACILHDDGVEVTADNIKAILTAANVTVEGYWPMLFAKLLEKKSLDDFISNVGAAPAAGGGGGAAAPAAGGGAAAADAPKEEEKKEEESEDEDMGFSLFD